MKNIFRTVLYTFFFIIATAVLLGFILAYLPASAQNAHADITPEKAEALRKQYKEPHAEFVTSDGVTLFLRRWEPVTSDGAKKDIAILIFHGITAYSGAYDMAGDPISKAGYHVFGIDYRGHGLSDGARGDSPGKQRFTDDLKEAVDYVKTLGFKKVVILGHSLGVASGLLVASAIPDKIDGLILLSGAYEFKKGITPEVPFSEKVKILSTAIFHPSRPVIHLYRPGITGAKDPLFTFNYTVRFVTMINPKKIKLRKDLNIPILVGVGDKDELFEVDKVRELYNVLPGNKKKFIVMKNATHAKIPLQSWQDVAAWLNDNFAH